MISVSANGTDEPRSFPRHVEVAWVPTASRRRTSAPMGLFQFGSLPHALATKNIELFAKTVLPALRRE